MADQEKFKKNIGGEITSTGKFERQKNRFTTPFGKEEGKLPVEANRYARFDIVYFNGFRVNKKMLKDYPNLWGYARDLYQQPGFGETTNFEAIKKHYHLCCLVTNPDKILPLGPDETLWNTPHGRDKIYQ